QGRRSRRGRPAGVGLRPGAVAQAARGGGQAPVRPARAARQTVRSRQAGRPAVTERRGAPDAEGRRHGRAGGVDVGGACYPEFARDDHEELITEGLTMTITLELPQELESE